MVTLALKLSGYRFAEYWQSLIIVCFAGLAAVVLRVTVLQTLMAPDTSLSHGLSGFLAVTLTAQYIAVPGWRRAAIAGGAWGALALVMTLLGVPL